MDKLSPFNMSYEQWIKLLKNPMTINWAEPLSEQEKTRVCSQLPKIASLLEKEQKELLQMKKMTDKIEREAGAKDTELSKERMRMRLRKKLADKKDAKAKEKERRKHSCLNTKDCEKCQKRRAKKMLAAQKTLDVEKPKDTEFSEEQQPNSEGEKDLLQYREPDKVIDDDEKEEGVQNNEAEEENENEDDENEFGAGACALPENYSSPLKDGDLSENDQQHNWKMQDEVEHFGNVREERRFNPDLPSHSFDFGLDLFDGEEFKSAQDGGDDVICALKMEFLGVNEGPQESASYSDFAKFNNYTYHF